MNENNISFNKSKRKLNCILLIDDDDSTNVLHQLVLEEAGIAAHALFYPDPQEALNYLNSCNNLRDDQALKLVPDLIFLDLNMPLMSGVDFMKAYRQLDFYQQFKPVLIVLTTSLQIENFREGEAFEDINGFRTKPLTLELLEEIMNEFFDTD